MKVLRRAKRALALLLAVSMLLPSVMSGMANGETADDTSGWTIGSTSQLSGNPTKGWELELGTHDGTSSAYQAQIDVARLQMGFDLSGLADDHTFILGFGDKQTGFGETESNVIYIFFGKKSNSSMEVQCFKNNRFLTNISVELDLTVPHMIGLQKSGNSWGIALDGEIRYTSDEIGQFVEAMASVSSNRTKVTFTPWTAGDKTGLIKNITFSDLGSWSSMGDTTKLTGNPKDGWRLQVVADPWGDYRNAAYEAAIDVTKLQIHFNLSEFTMNQAVRMKIGSTGFAQGIDLFLERVQDSVLRIYGKYSGKMGTVADKTFDFAADHVLEFVRAGGKWALAIDGVAWLEDDFYGTFIDSMSVSEGKTVVRINGHAGWNAEGNYPTFVINGINFTDADLGSWSSMGDTTKLTGNPKDGWRLQVVADPWGDYRNAAYEAAIDVTKLQIHFNLSEFTMNQAVRMKIGSTGFAQGIDLFLERVQDSVLRIYGKYSGKMGTVADKTFDFAADHVLEFVRAGGKWALAIDGVAWLEDDFYGTFIDSMSVSEGKTVVRINGHAGWNAEGNYPTFVINGINFTEKPAIPEDQDCDWDIHDKGMISVSGDAESGYAFLVNKEQEGSGSVLYKKPLDLGKQAIEFTYAPEDKAWTYMYLKSASLGYPNVTEDHEEVETWGGLHDGANTMTLRFERDGNDLKAVYWYGWAPTGQGVYAVLGTLRDFDWTKSHTMSFVQNQKDYSWKLMIDDILLEEGNNSDVTNWMNTNLNNYQQAGGAYIQIGARSASGQKELFETVKFVENKNQTEKPENSEEWKCNNAVVTGDKSQGYKLVGHSDFASAYYKEPMKPDQTEVEFRFDIQKEWATMSLSADPDMGILAGNDELRDKKGMIIILERKDTALNVQFYWDSLVTTLTSIDNFDFGAKHTISFVREWGSWYMVFDGNVLRNQRLDKFLFDQLVNVKDGVYYRFSANSAPFTFDEIRFLPTAGSDLNTEYDWEVTGYEPAGTIDDPTFRGTGLLAYKKLVDLENITIRAQIRPEPDGWQCIQLTGTMSSDESICPRLTVPTDGTLTLIFGRQERSCRVSLYGIGEDGANAEVLIGYVEAFDWEAVHDIRFVNKNGTWHIVIDNQSFEYITKNENTYVTDEISRYLNQRDGKVYVRFSDCWEKSDNTWGRMEVQEGAYVESAYDAWPKTTVSKNENGWNLSGEGTVGFTSKFDFNKHALQFQSKPGIDSWIAINFGATYCSSLPILQGVNNPFDMLTLIFARQNENTLRFSLYDGSQEILLAMIADFDFNIAHTLCFEERKGNWYINIDGRTLEGLGRDQDGVAADWIRKATKLLDGSAYVRIGTPGFTSQTITGVQIVDKASKAFEIPEIKLLEKKTTVNEPKEKDTKKPEPEPEPTTEPEPVEESGVNMTVVLIVLGVQAILAIGAVVVLLLVGRKKVRSN